MPNADAAARLADQLKREFVTLYPYGHLCPLCGLALELEYVNSICDELAEDWALSELQRRYLNYREGCRCRNCGSNGRIRNFAKTILETINLKYGQALQVFKDISRCKALDCVSVAEINHCQALHSYLETLPGLKYSEYASEDPDVPSEDLTALTYPDGLFDLVLMADVLEHVPDYAKALEEVGRVLKDDGALVFTTPYLMDRTTVVRARKESDGSRVHLRRPSYHGAYARKCEDLLVIYEFGYDFLLELSNLFDTSIYGHDDYGDLIASVFVCRKKNS